MLIWRQPSRLSGPGRSPAAHEATLSGNLRLHRGDHRFQVGQRFLDRERVHVPAQTLAGLQRSFQIMAGNLDGERIRDGLAAALLVLHPRRVRQGDPDDSSIDQKLDVDGVGVPRGNCLLYTSRCV